MFVKLFIFFKSNFTVLNAKTKVDERWIIAAELLLSESKLFGWDLQIIKERKSQIFSDKMIEKRKGQVITTEPFTNQQIQT